MNDTLQCPCSKGVMFKLMRQKKNIKKVQMSHKILDLQWSRPLNIVLKPGAKLQELVFFPGGSYAGYKQSLKM